jgi:hypothetical protein
MISPNDPGYVIARILTEDDLFDLRSRINVQIKSILKCHDSVASSMIQDEVDPLSAYHKLGARPEHGATWIKTNRLLSEQDAEWFENTDSIKGLRKTLSAVGISDEEQIGRSNYYWRLTRPSVGEDVGPVHRDEWFWLLNNDFGHDLTGLKRVKVWIAIQTEQGMNGLLVQPGSHKREDLLWEGRLAGSIRKPVIKTVLDPSSMILLPTPPGYGVIFHDKLLHGGALNQSKHCRCSIEFTLLVPSQEETNS